ncbi:hypothetical protein [Avibacterium paragallinarum]|uniref:hypothetical protein n=1 Tax=Avibacterium paragallinarum TaxID=728 RepID=UPI0021F6FBC7|nr:hypothetical protein [Avibacterium paragallinarum]UXN34339.1 hypothetical protein N8E86_09805 [Avibacterium paragallinarum]
MSLILIIMDMNNKFFENRNNLIGRFFNLRRGKQYLILLFILLIPFCFIFIEYQKVYWDNIQLSLQIKQEEEELFFQKRILNSLQQATQKAFTPEVTNNISKVNECLEYLLSNLQVKNSQWSLYQDPYIDLQLMGNFTELTDFLTEFLYENPQMYLLHFIIYKDINKTLTAEFKFKLIIDGVK